MRTFPISHVSALGPHLCVESSSQYWGFYNLTLFLNVFLQTMNLILKK